jgi:hypothetical protein
MTIDDVRPETMRVLLDANAAIRRGYGSQLARRGLTVETASDGREPRMAVVSQGARRSATKNRVEAPTSVANAFRVEG